MQLAFLKKILCVDDGQIPEIMRLHEPELQDLLHRRHSGGVWILQPGAPNFRFLKEKERIVVQVVDDLLLPDQSEWWRQSVGKAKEEDRRARRLSL